jgi:hypothetical protein
LAQLPADTLMSVPPTSPVQAPLLLDAWRNPIIFVPGGGMQGVTVTGADGNPALRTVVAPDRKGFWVSAGPDGHFTDTSGVALKDQKPYGDDNVYSFEN